MEIDLFLNHKTGEMFRVADRVRAVSGKEYEISERIACGGNAVVHHCNERITGEEYAIKFQLSLAPKRIQRFQREISLLQQIRHEQLISYIDHGECSATPLRSRRPNRTDSKILATLCFLVMPLADCNLTQVLGREHAKIAFEDYIGQFKGLARALSKLHEMAVHRDIKPENILVKGETWMLSDFGLCRFEDCGGELTDDGEPVGPRYWMSPEAVNRAIGNRDVISKRSDVFQLCSVFWFVVTGRHPTGCVSKRDWRGPDGVFKVIADALSHNEFNRPADGSKLVELLDSATLPPISDEAVSEAAPQ